MSPERPATCSSVGMQPLLFTISPNQLRDTATFAQWLINSVIIMHSKPVIRVPLQFQLSSPSRLQGVHSWCCLFYTSLQVIKIRAVITRYWYQILVRYLPKTNIWCYWTSSVTTAADYFSLFVKYHLMQLFKHSILCVIRSVRISDCYRYRLIFKAKIS